MARSISDNAAVAAKREGNRVRTAPSLDADIVPLRTVQQLVERAARAGVPTGAVLSGSGLSESDLLDGRQQVSYRALISVHESLSRAALPADHFLAQASRFQLADIGILGYAMRSSATLDQAIRIALRYYRTVGPLVALTYRHSGGQAHVLVDNVFDLHAPLIRQVTEEIVASFPPLVRALVGDAAPPVRVDFAYPPPPHAAIYEAVFQCPVRFAAPQTRYAIDARVIDTPVVEADEDALKLLEDSCRALLERIDATAGLSGGIRRMLLETPGTAMTAARFASAFNISERTLRRQLNREGTSFQSVVTRFAPTWPKTICAPPSFRHRK